MAKIYKRTDRVVVKIDDVTVKLAPMTLHQKTEVQMMMLEGRAKTDLRAMTRGIALALKFTLKAISGVLDSDDSEYKLEFEGDELTEKCVDDLMNMDLSKRLALVCTSLVDGIPTEFLDAQNKPLTGVEVVRPDKGLEEKKN